MKTIPAAIQTALDAGVISLATCIKMTLKDATVIGLTDYQTDLVVSAVTYNAIGGYDPMNLATTSELNVDNMDLAGFFDDNGITLAAIRAGALDNAALEYFKVNPRSIADGIIKLRAGTIGRVSAGDNDYKIEVRGLLQRLQQTIGEVVSPRCRAALYDARCKVRENPAAWSAGLAATAATAGDAGSGTVVKPSVQNGWFYKCTVGGTTNDTEGEPTWNTVLGGTTVETDGVEWETIRAATLTGTLSSATDRASFADSARTEPDGWFDFGVFTFTSGANNGIAREIKTYTVAAGDFETFLPFPYDIAGTETYSASAGCGKDMTADCSARFDNVHNHRAEPYTPGSNAANETPEVK